MAKGHDKKTGEEPVLLAVGLWSVFALFCGVG